MKIRLIIIVSLLILTFLGYSTVTFYYNHLSPNTQFEEDEKELFIPTNANFRVVMDSISKLLKTPESFSDVSKSEDYTNNIKSGRYIIEKGMNNDEILQTLRFENKPVKVVFHSITTPEVLAQRIARYVEADSLSLLNAIKDSLFIKQTHFDKNNFMAMYIPNTYNLFWNTDAKGFRDRMYKEYNSFWNEKRVEKLKTLPMNKEEVITLASIVNKESVKVDERPTIAGVYINRLKKGMKLQADPTVIYAIKKKENNFKKVIRRLFYRDLKVDSPYNTYKNKGLPPGPIITPDISAIDAVLNYEKHNYIYFVANPENYGYHLFANSYKQHMQNRKKYINWLRKNKIR